jgi:cytochrome c oxidase subunit 2
MLQEGFRSGGSSFMECRPFKKIHFFWVVGDNMTYAKRLKAAMFGLAAGAGIPALAWAEPEVIGRPAEHQLNMQPAVTGIGDYIYSLHNWMMIVCLIIFLAVFGVMFYSVFKHRKSLGHKPATFHESTAVEIAWTIVPFLIVIGMALPATHAWSP